MSRPTAEEELVQEEGALPQDVQRVRVTTQPYFWVNMTKLIAAFVYESDCVNVRTHASTRSVIEEFLAGDGLRVIFGTYQSVESVGIAQRALANRGVDGTLDLVVHLGQTVHVNGTCMCSRKLLD